jgi:hypothetical protein
MLTVRLQRALKLAGCLASLALAACAFGPIGPGDTLKSDEGAFVFKVITDASRGDSLLYLIDTIEMQSQEGPNEPFFIAGTAQREVSSAQSMMFSGRLKPGRYRFVRGRNLAGAGIFVGLGHFGSLEIRGGQVTQLGTLILHPIGEVAPSRSFMGYTVANMGYGYVPPDAEALKSFEEYFPALAQQVKWLPNSGFNLTPELNASAQLALNYKKRSLHINSIWQDERGNFFAGKGMGKILLKSAGRPEWREVDVGGWRGVNSVRPYGSGLIAGGEEGLLKFSPDGGSTWNDLVPPAWGQVVHLEVVQRNRVIAVVRHGGTWVAHVTDDPLAGRWKVLGTFVKGDVVTGASSVVRRGNTLVLAYPGVQQVFVMDIDNGQVETSLGPHGVVLGLNAQPNGQLVMRTKLFSPMTHLSEDGGRLWREMRPRGFVAFRDASTAYSVYDRDIAHSKDGGVKWNYLRQTDARWEAPMVREFVVDAFDRSLVVFMYDGAILRSRDEGVTWVKEQ